MSKWMPQIEDRKGPRYLAIADAIGEAIRDASLKPEERLATHRDMAYHLGVTVGTVTRAYAEAVRRGYVVGEVGRGTYVKPDEDVEAQLVIPYKTDPNLYDFSLNFQSESERVELLRKSLMVLAQDPGIGALMRYQSEQGMEHHREAFAFWAGAHGVEANPDQIIVSSGVQHAIMVSLMAVSRPGDVVLCEEYTYHNVKTIANQQGLKLQGLAMDEDGIVPEKFEEAVVQSGARVLYCMPSYQNPTGVNMPLSRRKEIAAIAKKYGVWVLEDDIYGFLHEDPSQQTPLAKLLPDQTFYLNGASKCVTPGIRVGFIHAPKQMVQKVAGCVRLQSWMIAPLNAELVYRWYRDGTITDLMAWHRQEAADRQAYVKKYIKGGDLLMADRAYHAWFRLPEPWTADMFCLRAREQNVAIMPAHIFHVGKKRPEEAVRICFGAPPTHENLEEGMKRLGALIEDDSLAFHSIM